MQDLFKNLLKRHVLLALLLVGVCFVTYIVGLFYQRFVNNPADLFALIFIVAIYVGAVYNQVKSFDSTRET
jgi:hypothetical protein